jgi:hypothetical protein
LYFSTGEPLLMQGKAEAALQAFAWEEEDDEY